MAHAGWPRSVRLGRVSGPPIPRVPGWLLCLVLGVDHGDVLGVDHGDGRAVDLPDDVRPQQDLLGVVEMAPVLIVDPAPLHRHERLAQRDRDRVPRTAWACRAGSRSRRRRRVGAQRMSPAGRARRLRAFARVAPVPVPWDDNGFAGATLAGPGPDPAPGTTARS